MITAGPLIRLMSRVTEVPEPTVAQFVRILREAGLFTTGARGVNAPKVTNIDVVRLLMALAITERPARAAEVVTDFGCLQFASDVMDEPSDIPLGEPEGANAPAVLTFESTLELVLDLFVSSPLAEHDAGLLALAASEGVEPASRSYPDIGVHIFADQLMAEIAFNLVGGTRVFPFLPSDEGTPECAERFRKYRRKINTRRDLSAEIFGELATGLLGAA